MASRQTPPRPAVKRPTGEHVLQGVVGIYVRVSRKGDREDERFHSPREQAERAAALAVAKGYTPGPVFEDIDVSGATAPADRPAMRELLELVDAGELAGVAAFALDRLSRDPGHGDALVKRITRAGGVVLTPDIPDALDSPTGEFTFGMLLQVAKLYRSQAGARFASAKERAILAGIPVGPPPVGYRCGADRRLEVDPELAPVIREIFERRARGAGYTELARLLDEATDRTWSRQAVAAILRNRIYATGQLVYGDIASPHKAEPIADEPLWHAAQRAEPLPRPSRTNGAWLLSGLLRCDTCGHSLAPWRGAQSQARKDGEPPRRYRCTNRACPERVSVDARWAEGVVPVAAFQITARLGGRSEEVNLGALEDALAAAERRLAQVLSPEAQDALGDAWAATAKARRTERDAKAGALGEACRATGGPAPDFRLEEVWESLGPEERRGALALYWKAIRVGKRNGGSIPVTFVPRGPHAEAALTLPTAKGPA